MQKSCSKWNFNSPASIARARKVVLMSLQWTSEKRSLPNNDSVVLVSCAVSLILHWNHELACLLYQSLVSFYGLCHFVWKRFPWLRNSMLFERCYICMLYYAWKHHNDYVMFTSAWTAVLNALLTFCIVPNVHVHTKMYKHLSKAFCFPVDS